MDMKKPTQEDAKVFLMLNQTFNTPSQRDAGMWFMREFSAKDYADFKAKYPVGGTEWGYVGDVLSFFETAGVLVSFGLLNENLFFDATGFEFVWKKIGHIIPAWQKAESPAIWENAVWLAERYRYWKKNVWKPNQKWKVSAR